MADEMKIEEDTEKTVAPQEAEGETGTDSSDAPSVENQPDLADEPDVTVITPGEGLTLAREEAGLSIEDLSKKTLITKDHLRQLEAMDVTGMARVYLVGSLKNCAQALNLQTEKFVSDYLDAVGLTTEQVEAPELVKMASKTPEKRQSPAIWAGLGLAAVAAIGVIVWGLTAGEATVPKATSSTLAVTVPQNGADESLFAEVGAVPSPERLELQLVALRAGWVEVRGADGTIFRSRRMATGETYNPRLGAGWTVTARDGAAFEWRVKDMSVGLLGEEATPIYAVSVDQVARQAAEILSPQVASAARDAQSTR